jgi:hypothetical protein
MNFAEFGVVVGATTTSIKFDGDYYYDYLLNGQFKQSINFATGLYANIIMPRTQEKWSLYNELLYTAYNIDGHFDQNLVENVYTHATMKIGFSYLKMNNLIRFKYPVRKAFVFLNAGVSNGYEISSSNYYYRYDQLYSNHTITEGKALEFTKKHEFGYVFGLGTNFKRYSFEIRYETGNGMSNLGNLNATTNRFFFLLGYKF